jgi:hypothetical protein
MRFPLTDALIDESERFSLRSSCCDCFFFVAAEERCAHDWPDEGQRRWPLDAPEPDGSRPESVAFCKEFELR